MPGVTACMNLAAPVQGQLHVYYNTNTGTLGFQVRSAKSVSGDIDQIWASEDADQPGIIVNPSQLASATYLGTNIVLGVTSKAQGQGTTPTQNDISIVSPVYKPVAATELNNETIASCSSSDTAWVFYLTGADANTLQIQEAIVGNGTPADYSETNKILPGSSLAAYYVPEQDTRYIIYQAYSDSLLREYTIDGGDNPIRNSTDADFKTPLAVAYVKGTTYLYYVHEKVLRRVTKTTDGWGSSNDVRNAHEVATDSQITVIVDADYNHVFYVADGTAESKFVHVMDEQ